MVGLAPVSGYTCWTRRTRTGTCGCSFSCHRKKPHHRACHSRPHYRQTSTRRSSRTRLPEPDVILFLPYFCLCQLILSLLRVLLASKKFWQLFPYSAIGKPGYEAESHWSKFHTAWSTKFLPSKTCATPFLLQRDRLTVFCSNLRNFLSISNIFGMGIGVPFCGLSMVWATPFSANPCRGRDQLNTAHACQISLSV